LTFPVAVPNIISMSTSPSLAESLEFAVGAARRAGEIIMPYFQGEVAVETKGDGSPVTLADRGAEQELRRLINDRFPDDGVLGEEFGEQPGRSGRRWVLDPIDGTKAFVRGVPLFGVLIGLEQDGEPVLGVVHLAALDELVYAARGQGCWWLPSGRQADAPPRRAQVSSRAPLKDGLLLLASYEYFVKGDRAAAHERLLRASGHQRGWGDCYGHVLVATGRAEACVDPVMSLWDNAPLLPILVEAGGTFTDWKGNRTIASGEGISTNGKVLDEVLRAVRE
jgi:histidinol phosphatase-like enzyme (inositol monophosphatase family)